MQVGSGRRWNGEWRRAPGYSGILKPIVLNSEPIFKKGTFSSWCQMVAESFLRSVQAMAAPALEPIIAICIGWRLLFGRNGENLPGI
jgi:hypothetical protein